MKCVYMANLSESERLNLKQLVNEMECDNNTENIHFLTGDVDLDSAKLLSLLDSKEKN